MKFQTAEDIGSGWLAGFSSLQEKPDSALTLTIANPLMEDVGVRKEIEQTLVDLHAAGNANFATVQSMDTVASTIFPVDFYQAVGSAAHFFEQVALAEQVRSHSRRKRWGTYVGRLTAYPTPDGPANQLGVAIERLTLPKAWSSVIEIPVDAPGDASLALMRDGEHDRLLRSGPCLAHVSVTRTDDKLSMIALYRHQTYYSRAYGNFLGLARLLAFLAYESGLGVGELTIVTGHAEAEGTERQALLDRVRAAAGTVTPVETLARPFGADSSDLELPNSSR